MAPLVAVLSSLATLGATVRRSELIEEDETGGIRGHAAGTNLRGTLGGSMDAGSFLSGATARHPLRSG